MYLLIFEDGSIRQQMSHPTEDDLWSVECRDLRIVKFNTDSGKFEELKSNPNGGQFIEVDGI